MVPPQKNVGSLNQVNIYLGKVTNFRGILTNKMLRIISTGHCGDQMIKVHMKYVIDEHGGLLHSCV